jgi:suppressor of tumorigenicity protein 13
MSDPELAAAMQNPKVTAAFTKMMSDPSAMSDPAKMQEMMSDPEVGPIMQKLMAKVGGAMGGGGMPGTGSAPPGADNDDIPDMDVDDDDDLPDLD